MGTSGCSLNLWSARYPQYNQWLAAINKCVGIFSVEYRDGNDRYGTQKKARSNPVLKLLLVYDAADKFQSLHVIGPIHLVNASDRELNIGTHAGSNKYRKFINLIGLQARNA